MIIDQFIDEEEIIKPSSFYKRKEKILDVCLITFSHEIFSVAKNMEGSVVVGEMHAAGGVFEIIKLSVKEKKSWHIPFSLWGPSCRWLYGGCECCDRSRELYSLWILRKLG